ncbi:MAG: hypothetical protein COU11_04690, partial [Candidatus Harrisonbacteria bacterium CG10_big_fil_rev_8_21_14_0_10_49_15]
FPRTSFLYIAVSLALIAWLIGAMRSGQIALRQNWLLWSLAGYIAILLISALAGGHFERSFFSSHERMTGILTFIYAFAWFVMAGSVFQTKDWLRVFRAVTVTGALIAIFSFLSIGGLNLESFAFMEHGGGILANSTFAGIYYLFAFLVSVFLLLKDSSRGWRWAYVGSLLLIGLNPDIFNFSVWQGAHSLSDIFGSPSLLLGQARASAISIGIGVLAMGVTYLIHRLKISIKRKGLLLGLGGLIIVLATLAFVGSATMQKGFGHNFLQKQKDFARPLVWRQGLQAFADKPIFGYGPNNFNYAFQDNYSPEVAFLEANNWFDKAHNSTFAVLVETGVVGALAVILVFLLAVWYAFRWYRKKEDVAPLLVVVVLLAHFIQTQTSFNTSLSIFLVFVLLAYLSAQSEDAPKLYKVAGQAKRVACAVGVVVVTWVMISLAILPAVTNRRVITAMASGKFENRLEMYESLPSLKGGFSQMLYAVTENYINALFNNLDQFDNPVAKEKIRNEFGVILDLYESKLAENNDDFRYLINYVNFIHVSRLFGVDRMERAGQLLERAEELSTAHPQLYWLSALQARYLGDSGLALAEIEKAVAMNETITERDSLLGQTPTISLTIREFLLRNKDNPGKIYYQVTEL